MLTRCFATLATSVLAIAIYAQAGFCQQPQLRTAKAIRQTSFSPEPGPAEQAVQFSRRSARVGDEVEQTLSLNMRLATSLRQGSELVESNRTVLRNGQRRLVTTTKVDGDRTTAVLVRYLEATKLIATDDTKQQSGPAPQPVQGKTYKCRRAADENGDLGELIVTEENGQVPPPEELEIVTTNMEMVGQQNPLAMFLAGRTARVGETIALPQEFADLLFNLGGRFGGVTRFDLTLEKIENGDDGQLAVFQAHVEAASNDSSQMRMQVEGALAVQVETCRAIRLDLAGPIAMSETRGSYSTVYQLIGTGQLSTSINSIYRDATR